MSATISDYGVVSELIMHLMDDSGWYKTDKSKAEK